MSIALAIKTNKAPFEAKTEEADVASIEWYYGEENSVILYRFDDDSYLFINEVTRHIKVISQHQFYDLAAK